MVKTSVTWPQIQVSECQFKSTKTCDLPVLPRWRTSLYPKPGITSNRHFETLKGEVRRSQIIYYKVLYVSAPSGVI